MKKERPKFVISLIAGSLITYVIAYLFMRYLRYPDHKFDIDINVLSAGVQSLFSETTKYGGTIVNILAHYVGYIFGFMVPAAVSLYVIDRQKIGFLKRWLL